MTTCAFCLCLPVAKCSTSGCAAPVCDAHGTVVGTVHINTGADSRGHHFTQIIECERCRIERERHEQSGAYIEGQALRRRREDGRITLRRMAEAMGLSMTALSRIERGLDVMTDQQRESARSAL